MCRTPTARRTLTWIVHYAQPLVWRAYACAQSRFTTTPSSRGISEMRELVLDVRLGHLHRASLLASRQAVVRFHAR
jgi:hypothetical protein